MTEGPFTEYTHEPTLTFPNLRPNTNCTFKVAVIENGETYWPVTLEVSTKKEGKSEKREYDIDYHSLSSLFSSFDFSSASRL